MKNCCATIYIFAPEFTCEESKFSKTKSVQKNIESNILFCVQFQNWGLCDFTAGESLACPLCCTANEQPQFEECPITESAADSKSYLDPSQSISFYCKLQVVISRNVAWAISGSFSFSKKLAQLPSCMSSAER